MEPVDYPRRLRYFEKSAEKYAVKPQLKELVQFDFHNLKTEFLPRRNDMILCRNVMIFLDQALLLGFIEINHDIAAQNHVVAPWQEFRLQVVKVKLHQLFELWLDRIFLGGFFEITQAAGVIDGLHLDLGVKAFLAGAQAGVANV